MWGRHFPVFRQLDSIDCGPTCLRMIARYYGKSYSLAVLRGLAHMSRNGVSILDLAAAAEQIGFRTLPARLNFTTLASEAPLPAIAHWIDEHYVVVTHISKCYVRLVDPGIGVLRVSRRTFLQAWTGTADGQAEGVVLLLECMPLTGPVQEGKVYSPWGSHLLKYLRPYGRYLPYLFVLLGISGLLQLFLPFLTQAVIDYGIGSKAPSLIKLILLGQLALYIGKLLSDFVQMRLLLHISVRTGLSMAADFLRKLLRLPTRFFEARSAADIQIRMSDHSQVQRIINDVLFPAASSALMVIVYSCVLAWYEPVLCIIFLIVTGFQLLCLKGFVVKQRRLAYEKAIQSGRVLDTVFELVRGIQDIKVYNAENRQRWRWERVQAVAFSLTVRSEGLGHVQQLIGTFCDETKIALLTFLAAMAVLRGHLSIGAMMAVQYSVGQMNGAFAQLQGLLKQGTEGQVALERSAEVQQQCDEDNGDGSSVVLPEPASLTLRDVTFSYGGPGSPVVLDALSMVIPLQRLTAIVGFSGSGKSTLLKLLLKLYAPQGGSIWIGDTPFDRIPHRYWRRKCGVVLQDGYVFSDTIARNISLSSEEIDMSRLEYAATVANLEEFIQRSPKGFDRVVGAAGEGLSQGQKQRLLIARAVYANPEYLLFDEATNALDATNEAEIMLKLRTFCGGKTVVTVAHRLSTVRHADQIVVLDKGRILESGTHDELTRLHGAYFSLVKNQLELAEA